jgi:uncharacterized glyoxalase superfamily protein PhnB
VADQTPNIFPAMRFADGDAALQWLAMAFGFKECEVHRDEQGTIHHAEMALGAGRIMFGQGDPASQAIYVAVEAAGAEITREIEDTAYGAREYSARDLDGHTWSFGTYRPASM